MKYILLIAILTLISSCKTTTNNQDADFGNIYMDNHQVIIFPVQ
jgi:hypothetical protein